jgi:hypothetical protein
LDGSDSTPGCKERIRLLTSGINLAFLHSPEVRESFARFALPASLSLPIGILEFLCALIYVIPRTSVLGAILLTGYLGGATATHVRIGDPTFIVPVIVGVLIWGGLFLRDARLRSLAPLRSHE